MWGRKDMEIKEENAEDEREGENWEQGVVWSQC